MTTPRIHWTRTGQLGGKPLKGDPSFAERLLLELNSECYGVEVEPGTLLNPGAREGHRFALLDVEGETLGTGVSAAEAIEAACLREARWMTKHADAMEARLRRVLEAVRVIQTGGAE
jgi:hypothetical protein